MPKEKEPTGPNENEVLTFEELWEAFCIIDGCDNYGLNWMNELKPAFQKAINDNSIVPIVKAVHYLSECVAIERLRLDTDITLSNDCPNEKQRSKRNSQPKKKRKPKDKDKE